MNEKTQRDKVWVAVIDTLNAEETVTPKRISDETGVSVRTVRQVLHVAEEIGLFIRESEHANTYYPYGHVAIHPGI
jgi:transcription initiation factor IIE alpha subunit